MTRLRAAGPSAARTRARWAFWTLIGVNVVMLWFFLGMSASVNQHARMLDEDSLRDCARHAAGGWVSGIDTDGARFVGPATVEFSARSIDVASARGGTVRVRCVLRPASGDAGIGDRLVVQRAEVVE